MTIHAATRHVVQPGAEAVRRELYFFDLYRVLEAALLCLLAYTPVGDAVQSDNNLPMARVVAALYLGIATTLLVLGRGLPARLRVLLGVAVDSVALVLAMHALPGWWTAIVMLLLFNVASAAVLLPLRTSLTVAAAAIAALLGEALWSALGGAGRPIAELVMFAASYAGGATLANTLGQRLLSSQALAEARGSQVASLAEVNELIIRRMRTGVLLVDADGTIRMANESAVLLLGDAWQEHARLADAAPQLALALAQWRQDGMAPQQPLQLAPDLPPVQPRFVRLLAEGELALVFLDDTSALSRHAESMTLATLGRFSASLAHEIRNPLAAISYATQLMQECPDIPAGDRRLLQIIYQQTQRMNGIVENVLSLARRERAQPDHVELTGLVRRFVDEYRESHPLETDQLRALTDDGPVPALCDPQQLMQVLTTLIHNALLYGRQPGEPARVTVRVHHDDGAPCIDVIDRGPGVADASAPQLFRPFHTTSEHGTGLGLYIARELCRANQASLEYRAVPHGGACFRIRLVGARALSTA